MRFLPLLLFVALAYGQFVEEDVPVGRLLTYRYDAQLVTGAPQSSKLTSGLRLIANLHLHIDDHHHVFAKLKNVNLQKMDKFIEDKSAMFNLQPEDTLLDGIEVDINETMISMLERPFTFRWQKGQVTHLRFELTDPEWSVNMKKGLISLLVVNLDKTYSPQPVLNRDELKTDHYDPSQPSYNVWEDTPVGYCLTTYTPVPVRSGIKDTFYLTKVRQYDTCGNLNFMTVVFNNFGTNVPQDLDHLNIQGDVTYSIEGNKRRFTILTAVGQSKIIFMPYGPHDGTVQTSINQTLMLKDDKEHYLEPIELQRKEEIMSRSFLVDNLKMYTPVYMAQDLTPYTMEKIPDVRRELINNKWSKDKMAQLLTWVANQTFVYPSEEVLVTMQTLVDMIRQSTNTTLKAFFMDPVNPEDKLSYLKKKILWDLLSKAGTTSASEVIVDQCIKVLQKEMPFPLTPDYCVSGIMAVGLFTPPSAHIISKMIELRYISESEQNVTMTEVTMLALGSIMGRAEDTFNDIIRMLDSEYDSIMQVFAAETANERKEELEKVERHVDEQRKSIRIQHEMIEKKVIKAIVPKTKRELIRVMMNKQKAAMILGSMRNAHIPITVYNLFHVIRETQLPDIVRILAIQAFETFTNSTEKIMTEVLKELELVQKNPTEPGSVRVQAFRTMINLGMPTPMLVRMVTSLANEEETQVSSYVWSALTQLANMTFAPYRLTASQARAALPLLKPVVPGIQESQYRHVMTSMATNVSMLKEFNHISDGKKISVSEHASYFHLFGTTNKAFQVSVLTSNYPKLLSALLGPNGFFTEQHSLFDLFKRTKRDVSDAKREINNIFDKLRVKPRDLPDTEILISIQLLNQVVRIADFSKFVQDNITQLMSIFIKDEEAIVKNGVNFAYQKAGMVGQFFMELPSEAGFPINLEMGLSYSVNITGEVSSEVVPSVFKEKRGNRPPKQISSRLAIKPEIVGSLMGKMSVDGYLFKAGSMVNAMVNIHSPMSINTTVQPEKKHWNIALSPPVSNSAPVLKLAVKPYVFSQAVANKIPKKEYLKHNVNQRPIFMTMQPVMISDGAKVKQTKVTFGEKYLGYKVTWQGQYLWRSLPSATAVPLLGWSSFALYVRPGVSMPPAIKMDVMYLRSMPDLYKDSEEKLMDQHKPLPDLPKFTQDVTMPAVIRKIEKEMGKELPPAPIMRALVFKLDTSTKKITRAMSLKAFQRIWNQAQEGYLSVFRTPIPEYDAMPWKMMVQSRALFPKEKLSIKDLMKPVYQQAANSDAMSLSQRYLSSYFFEQQLRTSVNHYAVQRLPSLRPQVILDRVFPEYIMENNHTITKTCRFILKTMLPICQQLKELKSLFKDSFQRHQSEELLRELQNRTLIQQKIFNKFLKRAGRSAHWPRNPDLPTPVTASVEYVVLKFTEAVLDFNAMMPPKDIGLRRINFRQYVMKMFSRKAVSVKNDMDIDNLPLPWLINRQLTVIKDLWLRVARNKVIANKDLLELIRDTANNVTMINQVIKEVVIPHNLTVTGLLLQAAEQHQIIVQTLSQFRYRLAHNVSDMKHYALKVQTKELLERGALLLHQRKMAEVCTYIILPEQKPVMHKLQHIDRLLMSVQNDYIPLPSDVTPWTGDSFDLDMARNTLGMAITRLYAIKDELEGQQEVTPPCVLSKLVDTTATLQQKVAIFKRILLAQSYKHKLTSVYEELDDRSMRLVISLTRLFRKELPPYVMVPDPIHYDAQSLIITKVQLELDSMAYSLDQLKQRMDDTIRGLDDLHSKDSQEFFFSVYTDCEKIESTLVKMTDEVSKALREESNSSQKIIMGSYASVYNKLVTLYNMLKDRMDKTQSQDPREDIYQKLKVLEAVLQEVQFIDAHQKSAMAQQPMLAVSDESSAEFLKYPYGKPGNMDSSEEEMDSSEEIDNKKKRPMSVMPALMPVPHVQGISFVANITFLNSDNSMAIRILARKSLAQRLWEMAQFFPESRDTCVTRAVFGATVGLPDYHECTFKTETMLNTYNHIHVTVQAAKKMPEILTESMNKLMLRTVAMDYDRATVLEPKPFVNPNSLHTIFDFAQPMKAMNLFYLSPEQTLIVESVPVSYMAAIHYPFQNYDHLPKVAALKATNRMLPGTCTMKSNVVRTNDGFIYQLPYKKGVSVLAMDCSEERTFAITAKPAVRSSRGAGMNKAQMIEILGEEHKVELIPDYRGDKVKIDGKRIPLRYDNMTVIKKDDVYGRPVSAVVVGLESSEGPIHVQYPRLGLDIYFSYDHISVQMCEVFQYRLCGLCGNYDGQVTKELVGPRGLKKNDITYSPEKFYQRYIVVPDRKLRPSRRRFSRRRPQ